MNPYFAYFCFGFCFCCLLNLLLDYLKKIKNKRDSKNVKEDKIERDNKNL